MNNELCEYRTNQICDLWPKLSYSDKIIIKHTIESYVGPNTKTLKEALTLIDVDSFETFWDDIVFNYEDILKIPNL